MQDQARKKEHEINQYRYRSGEDKQKLVDYNNAGKWFCFYFMNGMKDELKV